MIRLSASKIKTFATCSEKFRYEYIEHAEKKPRHPAAALGSAVHKTIELVYREHVDPVTTFLTKLPEELQDAAAPTARELSKFTTDGIKMVGDFPYRLFMPIDVEREFLLKFPNDGHPVCEVSGIIDQMYDTGFLDLKTNGRKPLQGVLDNNLQFILYDWAFKQLTGYEAEYMVWYHLRTQEPIQANVKNKMDEAQRQVDRILTAIETNTFYKNVGDACTWCGFRDDCLGRED